MFARAFATAAAVAFGLATLPASAGPEPTPEDTLPQAIAPETAAPQAALPESARPIAETDEDARNLYEVLKTGMAYGRRAQRISGRYLRQYDAQRAGTRMYRGPLGIRVPVHFNRSQARALVLNRMGKDRTLKAVQAKLARLDRMTSQLFEKVVEKLEPELAEALVALHQANLRADRALLVARNRLRAFGRRLNQQTGGRSFPAPADLRRLHRLAAVMRAKRHQSITTGRAFQTALEDALNKPVVVGDIRHLPEQF